MRKILALIFLSLITIPGIYCSNAKDPSPQTVAPSKPGMTSNEIRAGSICTIDDGAGKFGIVKVLLIDNEEAHIRIYKNKYDSRPDSVDIKTLSLGSPNDKDGFGIGHVPLARTGFDNWKPVMIAYQPVRPEELEGYLYWKEQH